MENTTTIKQYLEALAESYRNLSYEFDNYSPSSELYLGYAGMCRKLLHDLADETLLQPVVFREFNHCIECRHFNKFHSACRDDLGNEIKILVFGDTEACELFEPLARSSTELEAQK
jgi:hypothetical protein